MASSVNIHLVYNYCDSSSCEFIKLFVNQHLTEGYHIINMYIHFINVIGITKCYSYVCGI